MISDKYSIDEVFDACVDIVKALPKVGPVHVDYEKQLLFYSLYKQAKFGYCAKVKPKIWNVVERTKWEAWKSVEDKTQYQCKVDYIQNLRKEFFFLYKTEDKSLIKNMEFLKNIKTETLQIFFWDLFDEVPKKFEKDIYELRDKYFPGISLLKSDY